MRSEGGYIAVMVTGINFKIIWISSRIYKKRIYKKKINYFFIAVLLHFYDINYQNSTKSRMSNQKSGMVPDVTLIHNSKMDIITKFKVFIFKNYEIRGGGIPPPPQMWKKLAQRQRGKGLICLITALLNKNYREYV